LAFVGFAELDFAASCERFDVAFFVRVEVADDAAFFLRVEV
jgi:hypothetical protein